MNGLGPWYKGGPRPEKYGRKDVVRKRLDSTKTGEPNNSPSPYEKEKIDLWKKLAKRANWKGSVNSFRISKGLEPFPGEEE